MKTSYHGNTKPFVQVLYATADWDGILPLLQELDAKGLNLNYHKNQRFRKDALRRACAVIALFSAQSMADSSFEEAILFVKSSNIPLICVNLDHTPLNDSFSRLLFASNVIPAERYETPTSLAERIMTADSLNPPALTNEQKRRAKRMAFMLIAGSALIAVAAGLIIWQRVEAANQPPIVSEETEKPLADVAGLLSSGMTEQDLLKIHTLILAGDNMVNPYDLRIYWAWDSIVTEMQMDGETVWSIEGNQIARGTATDLSLIGRMVNLQELILINQSVTDLSPLQSLQKLEYLQLVDCPVESIEAISGLPALKNVILDRTNVKSLSPLQTCGALEHFIGSIGQCVSIDGLNNPQLQSIELFDARKLANLDALSVCSALSDLTIYDAEVLNDISGLSGCVKLSNLLLNGATYVRSSSALSNITTLQQVEIQYSGFTELNGLKQSRELKTLRLENVPVRDFSWTSGMDQLTTVQLHGTNLNNLNFLKNLGVSFMELHFSGDIYDYSGLAAIPHYSFMHVNPRNKTVSAVLPYIANSSFSTLMLYDCNGIDFSALPKSVKQLWIERGNLTSLEGLSSVTSANTITLDSVNRLSSLKGLADNEGITRITIQNCQRLTDYEDLYQKPYEFIKLVNLTTAPDLSRLQISDYGTLIIDSMPNITDISPLQACQAYIHLLSIRNMDTITDFSSLRNMKVTELEVPPQFEELAKQLRDNDVIDNYQLYFPDNVLWAEEEQNFALLSLEELDTLPDTLLSRVLDFTIIGDCIPDTETQDWTEQWDDMGQHFYIVDRQSQELMPVGAGVIDDISRLEKLGKVQYMRLYDQPLTSLQGIQSFADLRFLEIRKCPVTDAAAAFTLTQLETLSLFGTQVSSIQGIQNLTNIKRIDLNNSKVDNISALTECNFHAAMENGGLSLDISYIPCEDFSALASIPAFSYLGVGGHDAMRWLPYIEGKSVAMLEANNTHLTNDQLAAISALPQLTELQIGWNEQLTDLSPLLSCGTLTKLYINPESTEALASIEGRAQFTIEFN